MDERKGERAEEGKALAADRCLPSAASRPLPPARCLLSAVLLLAACGSPSPAAPGLSDSLMVAVLAEVHLADARAAHTGAPRDSLRAAALAAFDLDTLAFQRALDYYAAHPDAYTLLYDRALDQLARERRLH